MTRLSVSNKVEEQLLIIWANEHLVKRSAAAGGRDKKGVVRKHGGGSSRPSAFDKPKFNHRRQGSCCLSKSATTASWQLGKHGGGSSRPSAFDKPKFDHRRQGSCCLSKSATTASWGAPAARRVPGAAAAAPLFCSRIGYSCLPTTAAKAPAAARPSPGR
jgi:hypothetical protein